MVSICTIKLNFAEKPHPQPGNKMSHIKTTMRLCYENLLFDINLPLGKKEEEITDKKIHTVQLQRSNKGDLHNRSGNWCMKNKNLTDRGNFGME